MFFSVLHSGKIQLMFRSYNLNYSDLNLGIYEGRLEST